MTFTLKEALELCLSGVSVVVPLLFSLLIFVGIKSKAKLHFNLSFFFLSFAFVQFFTFSSKVFSEEVAIYTIALFSFGVLCLAPSFYTYLLKLTDSGRSFYRHFFPPFVVGFVNLVLFGLFSLFSNTDYLEGVSLVKKLLIWVNVYSLVLIFTFQNVIYITKMIKLLRRHSAKIGDIFSFDEGISLSWVKTFIVGYILFIACIYIMSLGIFDEIEWLFDSVILAYIIFAGFHGIQQVDIYNKYLHKEDWDDVVQESVENEYISNNTNNEAENPSVVDERISEIKNQVIELLEIDKLYLNHDLTLVDVSKKLNSNTKYVSEAINQGFSKNFISLINDYRIREAQRLLHDKEYHYLTIEAIGNKSGFKSKSSFNNAFKRIVGQTPSEFKNA